MEPDQSGDESWETIWPPVAEQDTALLSAVVQLTADPHLFALHVKAWKNVHTVDTPPDTLSLLKELRQKSGTVTQPFIDEALSQLDSCIGTTNMSKILDPILIHPSIPTEDGTDETEHEIRAMELFRGCVWELVAMFACELVALSESPTEEHPARPPSSCLDPMIRSQFLRKHLVAYWPPS